MSSMEEKKLVRQFILFVHTNAIWTDEENVGRLAVLPANVPRALDRCFVWADVTAAHGCILGYRRVPALLCTNWSKPLINSSAIASLERLLLSSCNCDFQKYSPGAATSNS